MEAVVEGLSLCGVASIDLRKGLLIAGTCRIGCLLRIRRLMNLQVEELLRAHDGEVEGIDELHVGLFGIELSVLIAAVLDLVLYLLSAFQCMHEVGADLRLHVDLRHLFLDVFEAEGDVLIHGHVRPECIVLEEEADLSFVGRDIDALIRIEDDAVTDFDLTLGRRLEARNHTKDGGFSTAGRTQQRDEGIVRDIETEVIDTEIVFPAFGDVC